MFSISRNSLFWGSLYQGLSVYIWLWYVRTVLKVFLQISQAWSLALSCWIFTWDFKLAAVLKNLWHNRHWYLRFVWSNRLCWFNFHISSNAAAQFSHLYKIDSGTTFGAKFKSFSLSSSTSWILCVSFRCWKRKANYIQVIVKFYLRLRNYNFSRVSYLYQI